jgi:hypothetical protein
VIRSRPPSCRPTPRQGSANCKSACLGRGGARGIGSCGRPRCRRIRSIDTGSAAAGCTWGCRPKRRRILQPGPSHRTRVGCLFEQDTSWDRLSSRAITREEDPPAQAAARSPRSRVVALRTDPRGGRAAGTRSTQRGDGVPRRRYHEGRLHHGPRTPLASRPARGRILRQRPRPAGSMAAT